ncbi:MULTISPECIES: hypothetical protein [Bacillus cereus group]|uniref:hypothetical protein n=1 Tax=Bacillus cereus group TaxID=86661 RepID=UPI001F5874F0|nr:MULTISPECIES: hypothetical protein [Bacillus cereus group]MDH2880305.1 hypothetical protein [Bacillus cytotoxicus]MDH2888266.1 hypothetical protein [Bacillus cytotoxicus]
MTSPTLKSFIQQHTHFITDLETIIDTIIEKQHVYLYDTSAISIHEKAYFRYDERLFLKKVQDTPVLITDVIAKEMRLIEDVEQRYMKYLQHFKTILYVEEQQLYDLLKVDFDVTGAKREFLGASEQAFTCIQPLRDTVRKARRSFQHAENIILDDYISFFVNKNDKNRGEISLLWTACVLNRLPGTFSITFIGIDHDLFSYVEQACLLGRNKDYNVYIMSNETLLQIDYGQHQNITKLQKLTDIYRNEDRKIMYFNRNEDIMHLIRQKSKLSNQDFIKKITCNQIQVVY